MDRKRLNREFCSSARGERITDALMELAMVVFSLTRRANAPDLTDDVDDVFATIKEIQEDF